MIILKDKSKTRVDVKSITSYSSDYDLNGNSKVDTIILTIGSAVRKLFYFDESTRNSDFNKLDELLDVDNNLR